MVTLLAVIVVAAVLFGVAVLATGRGDVLADAPPDRVSPRLPTGRVTAADVRRTRFALAFRGYRMADVDGVLDRLADELERLDGELASARGSSPAPAGASAAAPAAPAAASATATSSTAQTPTGAPGGAATVTPGPRPTGPADIPPPSPVDRPPTAPPPAPSWPSWS